MLGLSFKSEYVTCSKLDNLLILTTEVLGSYLSSMKVWIPVLPALGAAAPGKRSLLGRVQYLITARNIVKDYR